MQQRIDQRKNEGGAAIRFAPLRRSSYAAALMLVAAFGAPSASAQAPRGSVAEFLARAEPLIAMGPMALTHPDAPRLKADVLDAARRYKSRNDAQKKAGQTRRSCPPDSGDMQPQEWLRHLRSIPAAKRRSTSLTMAFEQLMEKRFPCPSAG